MKHSIFAGLTVLAALVFLSSRPVIADEEVAKPVVERNFFQLIKCSQAVGSVEYLAPRSEGWKPVKVGRFYPLGSTFRVGPDARGGSTIKVIFGLGPTSVLTVTNATEFAMREPAIGDQKRVVLLRRGRFMLNLPRSLKDGEFSVVAPNFVCSNLAGESSFDYSDTGDGDETVIRVITGVMSLEGRHYKIAAMRAADQIRIRTTKDDLFTSMAGESGDFGVRLDQGLVREKNYSSGEETETERYLNFSLSPGCAIKIFRGRAAVGGRVVVSTLAFDASGEIKNRCAFAEKRYNVNTGELVIPPKLAEDAKNAAAADSVELVPVKASDADNVADEPIAEPVAEPVAEPDDTAMDASIEG